MGDKESGSEKKIRGAGAWKKRLGNILLKPTNAANAEQGWRNRPGIGTAALATGGGGGGDKG